MRTLNKPVVSLVLVLLFALAGCGYHVAGKGGAMPGGVQSLHIPVFTNATPKPDIESVLTSAFTEAFVNTVEVAEEAEAALYGTIKSYTLTPISYNQNDINQEYRLTVVISLRIISGGKTVWEEGEVTDTEDYTVNISDVSATKEKEAEAFKKLARDTARLVKERMQSGF